MTPRKLLLLSVAAVALLGACATPEPVKPVPVGDRKSVV